jgi:uncharacterized protein (TIGR03435 family)
MARLTSALLVGFVLTEPGIVRAQGPSGDHLAFDVVSVKPNTSGESGLRLDILPGGRLVAVNLPLKQFIRAAYTLQLYQIEGAPRWTEADRFDISAVTERNLGGPITWTPGTYAPVQRMMQAVLMDRFKMKAHMDERDSPGYALELRSTGSTSGKLTPAEVPCRSDCRSENVAGRLRARNLPLLQFAELLSQLTGRFVTDATGLTGAFDFDLQWAPESQAGSDLPSLFTAVQEQLGLRLTPRRVRTPMLVVDAIERPSAD